MIAATEDGVLITVDGKETRLFERGTRFRFKSGSGNSAYCVPQELHSD